METEQGLDTVMTLPAPRPSVRPQVKQPKLWHVVLLDDEDHTYEYVIEMMVGLFGKNIRDALETAKAVDKQGRAICTTTHRELAELKVEQIHGYGRDVLIASCKGSMSAVLEPADSGDDEGEPGR